MLYITLLSVIITPATPSLEGGSRMTIRAAIYPVPELSTVPPHLVLPLLYSNWGPGRKWNLIQNLQEALMEGLFTRVLAG